MQINISKEKLLNFIKKYSLGKENDSVKFKIDSVSKNIEVRFITDDRSMVGEIYMNGVNPEETVEFGVFDTTKLTKMVSVLEENISLSIEKNNLGEISSVIFSDGKTEVSYMTAKLSILPRVPTLKTLPAFTFAIEIDEYLLRAIKTGVSSVFDAKMKTKSFTLKQNKDGKTYLFINYLSNANSNKIKYEVTPVAGNEKLGRDIAFSAEFLNQALIANADYFSEDGKKVHLMVSESGFSSLVFETADFLCKYYLVEITTKA